MAVKEIQQIPKAYKYVQQKRRTERVEIPGQFLSPENEQKNKNGSKRN